MFLVKATYDGEIRRISFPDLKTFPTFDQLNSQLQRIFPSANSRYLSKLLFCPDASQPARILIAREIRSSIDYSRCILQFNGRSWPNASLRFSMLDETSTVASGIVSRDVLKQSSERSFNDVIDWAADTPLAKAPFGVNSPLYFPPPAAFPLPTRAFSQPFIDSELTPVNLSNHGPNILGPISQPPSSSHQANYDSDKSYSMVQAKAEISTLLRTFQDDLDRTLTRIFGQASQRSGVQHMAHNSSLISNSSVAPFTSIKSASNCPTCEKHVGQTHRPASAHSECDTHVTMSAGIDSLGYQGLRLEDTITLNGLPAIPIPLSLSPSENSQTPSLSLDLPYGNDSFSSHNNAGGVTSSRPMVPSSSETLSSNEQPPFTTSSPLQVESTTSPTLSTPTRPPIIHENIACDACGLTIEGIRHKCLDCPDFDLCTRCISFGAAENHDSHHQFFELAEPTRIIVHTVYQGPERALQDSASAASVEPSRDHRIIHNATCDLCDSVISGCRYKCTTCPDFDTCDLCFTITTEQHPNHSFVKISRTEDYISRDEPTSPRHFAECNVCHKFITGVRYKCMHLHCPDFDLCERCEAFPIPQHPNNHPMLKMKSADTSIPLVYRAGQTPTPPFSKSVQASGNGCMSSNRDGTLLSWDEPPVTTLSPVLHEMHITPPLRDSALVPLPTPQLISPYSPLDAQSRLPPIPPDNRHSPQWTAPLEWTASLGYLGYLAPKINNQQPPLARNLQEELHPPSLAEPIPAHQIASDVLYMPNDVQHLAPRSGSIIDQPSSITSTAPSPKYLPGRISGFAHVSQQGAVDSAHESDDTPLSHFNTVTAVSPLNDEALLSRSTIPQFFEERPPRNLSLAELLDECRSLSGRRQAEPAVNSHSSVPDVVDDALSARFVLDMTVPDGQVLAPGVTFVKTWLMANSGTRKWPSPTRVVFVGGAQLANDYPSYHSVHDVDPGQDTYVSTCELKAPDTPGRYTSYWRLQDDNGQLFGDSIWVEIEVANTLHSPVDQSLKSSSILMPDPTSPDKSPLVYSASPTDSTEELLDDGSSDTSSMSIVSMPSSEDENDNALWADSRAHFSPGHVSLDSPQSVEYVVLYDDNTSEEAE